MKNFTLAAAGMAITITASAGLNMGTPIKFQPERQAKANMTSLMKGDIRPVEEISSVLTKRSKGKKAPSAASIEGDYIFSLGDYYFQGGMGEIEDEGTISFQGDFCVLDCPSFEGLPFVGEYDESTGEITFFGINLGLFQFQDGGEYYIAAEPFEFNGRDALVYTEFSVKYDESINGFEFPVNHGVMWNIYTDENCTDWLGYYWGMDIFSLTNAGAVVDPEEGWTDFDTATFFDGWMLPGYGENPVDWPWTVLVQRNDENPNLYRVYNPYTADESPFAEMAEDGGFIEFDITDPARVVITPKIWNGMKNQNSKIQNTDFYSYYHTYPEYIASDFAGTEIDTEEAFNAYCEEHGAYTSYDQTEGMVYFNNCRIQVGGKGCYVWQDQYGNSFADIMFGALMFDEIYPEVVETKVAANVAEDGAVEFFNLQGVRVANPQAGQLVIKRQGDKASKIIVK